MRIMAKARLVYIAFSHKCLELRKNVFILKASNLIDTILPYTSIWHGIWFELEKHTYRQATRATLESLYAKRETCSKKALRIVLWPHDEHLYAI